MTVLCYPNCSTCKKALKWLDDHQIAYTSRNIKTQPPTAEELTEWHQASGLPLKAFFNTSGRSYQALGLKDKLPGMSPEEQIALLSADGMLVKRPLLVAENTVLVGFRQEQWEQLVK